jgi:hypothetical protein
MFVVKAEPYSAISGCSGIVPEIPDSARFPSDGRVGPGHDDGEMNF